MLVVLQVSFEGSVSKSTMTEQLKLGNRRSGDLVPWLVSQQFQLYSGNVFHKSNTWNQEENLAMNFGQLVGCRIVRVATNPEYFRLGYGKRAISELLKYIQGKAVKVTDRGDGVSTSSFENLQPAAEVALSAEQGLKPRKMARPLLVHVSEVSSPCLWLPCS